MKTPRFNMSISFLTTLCLLVSTASLAAEVAITPYQASYKLFKSGMHIAKSTLSLEQSGQFWRWRLLTKPRGVYKLLSDKKPYFETTFTQIDGQHRIHNILLADKNSDKQYETARFNWNSHEIDIQRKGKRHTVNLPEQVYDFLTIHLLVAQMMNAGTQQMDFKFYLKGEVLESNMTAREKTMLSIDGKSIETSLYHQTIVGRKTTSKYYYGPDSQLLPLKIENINSKGKTSIMILNRVVWL